MNGLGEQWVAWEREREESYSRPKTEWRLSDWSSLWLLTPVQFVLRGESPVRGWNSCGVKSLDHDRRFGLWSWAHPLLLCTLVFPSIWYKFIFALADQRLLFQMFLASGVTWVLLVDCVLSYIFYKYAHKCISQMQTLAIVRKSENNSVMLDSTCVPFSSGPLGIPRLLSAFILYKKLIKVHLSFWEVCFVSAFVPCIKTSLDGILRVPMNSSICDGKNKVLHGHQSAYQIFIRSVLSLWKWRICKNLLKR